MTGSSHCINHTAAVTDEQRRAWAARGGKNSSAKARAKAAIPGAAMDSAEIGGWLSVCFRRLIVAQMDPGLGNAISGMAKAMLAVQAAGEIEERLASLEEAVAMAAAQNNRRYPA